MITVTKIILFFAFACIIYQQKNKPTVNVDYHLNKELTVHVGVKQSCRLPGGIKVNNRLVVGPL